MAADSDGKRRAKAKPPAEGDAREWLGFSTDLYSHLVQRLRHGQDALDVAQEVYLRLLRVEKPVQVHNFLAYMFKIAAHVIFENRYRLRDSHVTFDSQAVESYAERPSEWISDEPYERISTQQQIEQVLEQMPPQCQAILLMYTRDGMSCADIARHLQLSGHTVKKYLTRAMAKLRNADWSVS